MILVVQSVCRGLELRVCQLMVTVWILGKRFLHAVYDQLLGAHIVGAMFVNEIKAIEMRDQVLGQDSFWCWLASTGTAWVPHSSPKHYLCQAFALGLAIAGLGELSLLGTFDCLSATCGPADTHTGAGDSRHLLSMWFAPKYFRGFHIFDIWLPSLQLPLLKHVRVGTLLDCDLLQIFGPLRIQ